MSRRAAIIGCGRIASGVADDPRATGIYSHAEAYVRSPSTVLVSVADVDAERAERCAQRWDAPVWRTDVEELLALDRPEVVSICTPDGTHEELLELVLGAEGVRGVLVEKPVALTAEAARRLADTADRRGIVVAVNYHRRYAASCQELRTLVEAGAFGAVVAVTGVYAGGLFHNGTHLIDLLRFLFGELSDVTGSDPLVEGGADPSLDAGFRIDSGGRAVLLAAPASLPIFELDAVMTGGRIRLSDHGNTIETAVLGESPFYSGYPAYIPDGRRWSPMGDVALHAVEDLVACLDTGQRPRCSIEDGVAAVAAAESVRAAAANGPRARP